MAKNLTTKNTAADLRTAYLVAFDNFSTDPVEVGNKVGGNSRYGRELLATLMTSGLICNTLVNDADMVWQCNTTYDNATRAEAEATIDEWLATWDQEVAAPVTAVATSLTACKCGCTEIANKGRDYRPGHDARHAGNVGRMMAEAYAANNPELAEGVLFTLPSAALRAKAKGVALKAAQGSTKARKATGGRTKVAKDERQVGTVKVGRWTYPAMKDAKGGVVRNTKRDGSGEWIKASEAADFRAK